MPRKRVADMSPSEHAAKLATDRLWRLNHKESIRKSSKKYAEKNKEKIRTYSNQWRNEKYATDPVYRKQVNVKSLERYEDVIKNSPEKYTEFKESTKHAQRRLRERRQELRKKLQQAIGGKCVDCGITDYRLLDFDHKDPKTKLISISQSLNLSFDDLLVETKKCDLRCPNCHRLKTIRHGDNDAYKNREFRNQFHQGFKSLISLSKARGET